MKSFNFFKIIFFILILSILNSCGLSNESEKDKLKICPQCKMPLPKSNINTTFLIKNDEIKYFDDIGCMILWANDNHINLKNVKTKAFTTDTKRYMDVFNLYYSINENTPMHYGFGAYENKIKNSIDFNEVILRMLRGENMANPKIRKQILGY